MPPRNTKPLTEEEVEGMWAMFGPAPVLKSEDTDAYEIIRQGHTAFYRPSNMFQLKLVRELVDTEWEMFRLFRIRTSRLGTTYTKGESKNSYNLLEWPFSNIPEINRGLEVLDRLDKWQNTATVRRNNLLKLLEYYCPPSDDNASIPEAEYKQIEQNQTNEIAGPPIAPPELVAHDVTTQTSNEPVELAKE